MQIQPFLHSGVLRQMLIMTSQFIFILCLFTTAAFCQSSKMDQARKLYESKDYGNAKELLIGVTEDDKNYAEARYYLGRITFNAKDYDGAAEYFEEATEADEKVADYFNWLGNSYGSAARDANIMKQGMLAPKMKNAWEQAVKLDPKA